jgi:hypothetical protein
MLFGRTTGLHSVSRKENIVKFEHVPSDRQYLFQFQEGIVRPLKLLTFLQKNKYRFSPEFRKRDPELEMFFVTNLKQFLTRTSSIDEQGEQICLHLCEFFKREQCVLDFGLLFSTEKVKFLHLAKDGSGYIVGYFWKAIGRLLHKDI